MSTLQRVTWGICGGEEGQADALFRTKNCVGLGWKRVGDLSAIPNDRAAFKAAVIQHYPGEKPGTIARVSALYGKVSTGEFGLFVSLGSFSPKAAAFAKSKSNLRLIDGEELVALVFQHYEQFDSRYKGLLPLRRVYVPERIEEGAE